MKRRSLYFAMGFAVLVWIGNSSLFVANQGPPRLRLLAHRGVHQIYAGDDLKGDTCTANPVLPASHGFIENTIPSMQAAFDAGAKVVELDVHLTPDNVFAVFHDWRLECRTNGTGVTDKTSIADLKSLDIGYGYSPDAGKTTPLRGTGIGLMPTLTEVFAAFPNGRFLINFKSRRRDEGTALAEMLNSDPSRRAQVFGVYGGGVPTRIALDKTPGLRGYDKASIVQCLGRYQALGWLGIIPAACRDSLLVVPINYAPFLWGWPDRFQKRMREAGSEVILLGPYGGGGFSSGIDTVAQFAKIPRDFSGFIWTNRIELIGPLAD